MHAFWAEQSQVKRGPEGLPSTQAKVQFLEGSSWPQEAGKERLTEAFLGQLASRRTSRAHVEASRPSQSHPLPPAGQQSAGGQGACIIWQESNTFHLMIRAVPAKRPSQPTSLSSKVSAHTQPLAEFCIFSELLVTSS